MYYYIHYLDEADEKQLAIFTSKEHANAFRYKQGSRWQFNESDKWSGDLDVNIQSCGIAEKLSDVLTSELRKYRDEGMVCDSSDTYRRLEENL